MFHTFPFEDSYILLDVESGAIHRVDGETFLVAQAMEQGADAYACGLPRETVDDVLSALDELRKAGSFDAPPLAAPAVLGGAAIKSMCLHVAHDCNLRCKYCFAATGDFHGARMLRDEETGKRALDFLMRASGGRKHLEVDLFGGEPLMNLPVCKALVAYGRTLERQFNKEIHFTMTTNCVALTDEAIEFINTEMYNVVISLDGRREIHDALRPTVNGKGSFDIILKNAQKLIETRGDKEYYVRGTFTRNNLDFLSDVRALRELGFDQISIEPVVLPEDSPYAILPEHYERVEREYDALAKDFLSARKSGDTWYNFFHFMFDPEGGPCLRKRINGCGAGSEYVAVTPDGDIYPCHQFVGLTEWKLGNVFDGVLDESIMAKFSGCNVCTKEKCRKCWAKYYCSGGCMANAYLYGGGIDQPHEMSCRFMRKRLECAIGVYVSEHA